MTKCEELSERMGEVARGESTWSAEESGHLAGCEECAGEWRLVQATARLGAGLSIDPAQVAARVRDRLADEKRGHVTSLLRRPLVRWVVALAAIALLAVALRPQPSVERGPRRGAEATVAVAGAGLTELDQMSSTELETLLQDLDSSVLVADGGISALSEMSADELERVLHAWES